MSCVLGKTAVMDFIAPSNGDCQVDCQPLELTMFSLDGGGQVQAADLVM